MNAGMDYYSEQTGFVIEGHVLHSREAAVRFLKNECDMDNAEAYGICQALYRAFLIKRQRAQRAAIKTI